VARWAPLALAAVVLLWHAHRYDFVTDDAYISFVFARNLADHGQLTFNLGDPVEGYTNFLWTFILGALMVVGVPAPWASQVLGVGFGLGTLYLTFRIGEKLHGRGAPLAGLAPLLLACSSGFACWSSGGLETQLYTFLIALALDAYLEADERPAALRRMAIALALSAMTRPEGLLLAALFVVHRLAANLLGARRWRPSKGELVACAWFLGLWAPWFAWRWWYYGWPFPNTYYVKAAGAASPGYEAKMRGHGWHYVGRWVEQTRLVWVSWLVAAGLWSRPRTAARTFVTLTVPIAAVYLFYAASVGGDFMGLHRFIMPLFVIAALLVALGLAQVIALCGRVHQQASTVVGVALVGAVALGFALDQRALTTHSLRTLAPDRGIDTPGYLKLYAHDRLLIGERLRPCLRPDDFAIYGGVGALPWTSHLQGVDVFGLVSDKVAHQVPRTRDRPGHNKWAPDALLDTYHPTIILHCYDLRRVAEPSPLGHCDHGYWERAGFEKLVLHVPGLRERGEYLTFLARRDRALSCPGLSR
jgi:arabinofuranosyltransferase